MTCKLVVKRFRGEITLGAAAVLGETAVEMPRQPLGDERAHNGVDITCSVANRQRRSRSSGLPAVDAQYSRQNKLDASKLQIFGAWSFHAAPPCRRATRRRGCAG